MCVCDVSYSRAYIFLFGPYIISIENRNFFSSQ